MNQTVLAYAIGAGILGYATSKFKTRRVKNAVKFAGIGAGVAALAPQLNIRLPLPKALAQ